MRYDQMSLKLSTICMARRCTITEHARGLSCMPTSKAFGCCITSARLAMKSRLPNSELGAMSDSVDVGNILLI